MTERSSPGHEGDVVALSLHAAGTAAEAPAVPCLAAGAPAAAGGARATLDVEAAFTLHFDFVWRSLRRLGVAEASLEDAAQDVFLVAHRHGADFEGRASVKTWLFAIARRVAHDHRRARARKGTPAPLPLELEDPGAPSPQEDAERREAARLLHDVLQVLDEDRRAIFVLAELEGLSAPEIADALGVKLNTVYSRLRLARRDFDAAVARRLASEGSR